MDISLRSEVCRFINFAMQQNYVPAIYSITVTNNSDITAEKITVSVTSEPEFAPAFSTIISSIEPHKSYEIRPVSFKASPEFMFSLTEKMAASIFINAEVNGELSATDRIDIDLLAYDQWNGTEYIPEIISAYVTPNHPSINEVIARAGTYLKKWCGDPSFTAYQTENPNHVRNQTAAIYAALQEMNIAYCGAPASFEAKGQRIRMPSDVLQNKSGTCLDLTLLYASCLEAVSINPVIILQDTHAFIGVWLDEQTFSECTVDDPTSIIKRCADGINELCVVECTALVAGKNISFEDAEKSARDKLAVTEKFNIAVDVKRSRGGGIRPMPMRVINEQGSFIADYGVRSSKDITSAPTDIADSRVVVQQDKKEITKLQMWERKLLDLSLRNYLLSFRATKNAVQLMISNLNVLEDRLASGDCFTIMPQPNDWAKTVKDSSIYNIENDKDIITTISESEFKNKRIRTFLSETELEKNCKALYRAAKLSLEENGSNTLYLALGFLRWYETDKSEKARYAPLVLIPVDIVRNVQEKSYKIRIRDEETQMNITLLELLRQDFGIDIGGLDPLPADESGVDLQLVFNTVRRAVMEKKRWDIENFAFIGLFSFSQFIMWNDLRNRTEDIQKNKVVASLISGKMEWQPIEKSCSADNLDTEIMPADLAVPTSADSSQLAAICDAAAGQSFVLHGPPGTGKSQTITNMIANALYNGKSVLFVAEKMAALSVVQKRLEGIGIGAFCLELHSNKAQKRVVLSQLERALNIGHIKSPDSYAETADKLYNLRCELNDVMNAIHKKRACGLSLYEAVTLYEKNAEYRGKIALDSTFVGSMSLSVNEQRLDAVNRLKSAASVFNDADVKILSDYGRRDYNVALKEELLSDLKKGETALSRFNTAYNQICDVLSVQKLNSKPACNDMNNICGLLCGDNIVMPKVLSGQVTPQRHEYICGLLEKGKEFSALTNEISDSFDNTVFSFDASSAKLEWKKASSSWFLAKSIGKSKLVKSLRLHAKNADTVTPDNYTDILDKLIRRNELLGIINSAESSAVSCINEVWLGENTKWESAITEFNANIKVSKLLAMYNIFADEVVSNVGNSTAASYCNAYRELDTFCNAFNVKYNVSQSDDNWLCDCETHFESWQLLVDKIREWSALLREKDNACEYGLSKVCDALLNGDVSADVLTEAYLCAVSHTVAADIIDNEQALSAFSGRAFEDSIKKFAEISDEFRTLTINELAARLSAKVPDTTGGMAGSSEIGILQKAIKNGGRMLPIRKLFDQIPLLLRRICPCMLMSPISVAQYIDPSYPKFDLVIFDEASQLPTCEAVGAIARGENVIVVGDPKQLPPTSFFAVNHVDEENFDKEDLESVLDDCLALSMPQKHLLWHYRSRHESLIAYSNSRFYDNKLYTFPSPNDLESRVTFVKVDGYYDKGASKQNKAEAQAVINEVVRRLDDEELRKESIGIVTFNIVQQSLIDDMLADKFRERPDLEQIANEMYEPILVKNLENVQGDERDVILFSIGYGPDKNGKVSMNFGPINRDGGWRRLNVAISRARKCMTVFSTITYDMIDMSRTTAEGVAGLKGFLEFAQKGASALAATTSAHVKSENAIEMLIADEIEKAGYLTRCNIGCSEYRLDIGIINPTDKNKYILGIMCDGDSYISAKTANDRNLSQPSVLKGLGWNLMRVWTLDWFDNKQKVLDSIFEAISDAMSGKAQEKSNDVIPAKQVINDALFDREASEEKPNDRACKYVSTKIKALGTSESFYQPSNRKAVSSLMIDILETECPISRKLLFKKVMSAFDMNRSTAKADAYLTEILESIGCRITKSNNNAFCWCGDVTPENISYFRQPDSEKRAFDDIPTEEIANAVLSVLEQQLTLTRTDLIKETAKCFGYVRSSAAIESAVTESIILCKKRRLITISSDNGKISLC